MREKTVQAKIEGLRHMMVGQLEDKYREVFGEETRSNHKQFLFRRIAWRIQANAWGGLSERARRRAKDVVVRVREDGFEWRDRIFGSLSAAVRAATGTRWNGFAFFGLSGKPGRKRGEYR